MFTLCSANGAEFGLVVIVGAKKVIMEWTDDKVFNLIKLYESYPCMYDVTCKEYTTEMLLIQGWVHNKRLLLAFFQF